MTDEAWSFTAELFQAGDNGRDDGDDALFVSVNAGRTRSCSPQFRANAKPRVGVPYHRWSQSHDLIGLRKKFSQLQDILYEKTVFVG